MNIEIELLESFSNTYKSRPQLRAKLRYSSHELVLNLIQNFKIDASGIITTSVLKVTSDGTDLEVESSFEAAISDIKNFSTQSAFSTQYPELAAFVSLGSSPAFAKIHGVPPFPWSGISIAGGSGAVGVVNENEDAVSYSSSTYQSSDDVDAVPVNGGHNSSQLVNFPEMSWETFSLPWNGGLSRRGNSTFDSQAQQFSLQMDPPITAMNVDYFDGRDFSMVSFPQSAGTQIFSEPVSFASSYL